MIYLCFPLFLFSLFWPPPFFPFSFFVSLLFFSSFLPSFLFFISVSGSCFFFLFCLLLGSRCYFVFLFLLAVFFCFESSCLISVCFASCFLVVVVFVFVALVFCNFFDLWLPIKNISQKIGIAKNPKMKNAEKRTLGQEQLAQVCSHIVSFFLFLCFFKFCIFCWKHYKNRGFRPPPPPKRKNTKKNKNPSVKNWSKLALKTGPSMLRNKLGPVFNTRIGYCFCFFFFSLTIPLLSAGRTRFSKKNKKKKQKTKNLDQFLTLKKAKIGPVLLTLQYICVIRTKRISPPNNCHLHGKGYRTERWFFSSIT